jgi:hypothetical protein
MSFIIYFLFVSIGLSQSYNPSCGLSQLTWVFFSFFSWFIFQSYPSILGWLRIKLCNLFQFVFYEVFLVSSSGSRVYFVDLGDLLCLIFHFYNLILQHSVDYELSFIIDFDVLFIGLLQSHDSSLKG